LARALAHPPNARDDGQSPGWLRAVQVTPYWSANSSRAAASAERSR
jgi:hypothetical protein